MIFKPSKVEKAIISALKRSGDGFEFDPEKVKYRLLASVNQAEQKPKARFRLSKAFEYSVAFAGMVIAVSATFAFASNSQPGDKLFALNKFGEQFVLKLPLSEEQKAKVQEHIVIDRLEALDTVEEARQLEVIKESDESLKQAVDAITENKQRLEAAGRAAAAQKLEKVLDQLQTRAMEKEVMMKTLEEKTEDAKTKEAIRSYRQKFENSRKKAQSHIKRFQTESQDKD